MKKIWKLDTDAVLISDFEYIANFIYRAYKDVFSNNRTGIYIINSPNPVIIPNVTYYSLPNYKEFYYGMDFDGITSVLDINEVVILNEFLIKNKDTLLSNKPIHPNPVMKMIKDVIAYEVYHMSPYKELLLKNPCTNDFSRQLTPTYISCLTDVVEVIESYVDDEDTATNIYNLLETFIDPIETFIANKPSCIYSIDIRGTDLTITRHIDIRAYRFSEIIKEKDYDESTAKYY